MSHFAQVVDGIVTQVIVAERDVISAFPNASSWYQTSYNTRANKHLLGKEHLEVTLLALVINMTL